MYTYMSALSTATPWGPHRAAAVAGPPSPVDPEDPVPAKVLTIDDEYVIFLILWLL